MDELDLANLRLESHVLSLIVLHALIETPLCLRRYGPTLENNGALVAVRT